MFDRLTFEDAPYIAQAPQRADVALFVGFVRRRAAALPSALNRWLSNFLNERGIDSSTVESLYDIPVPVDSWNVFDRLFAWEQRPLDEADPFTGRPARFCHSYMGAAVRSFFAQGGRKCYVVRVGDPWVMTASYQDRLTQMDKLIPGFSSGMQSMTPFDAATWHGVGWLFGLQDASFLCLPDLPDMVRTEREVIDVKRELPPTPEYFVECSDIEIPLPDNAAKSFLAPRCDDDGYRDWARALRMLGLLVARYQREVQIVAALPIPAKDTAANLLDYLTRPNGGSLAYGFDDSGTGIASAFVQLAYPWLRTPGSERLPEALESPDAVLTGLLARNALTQGTFSSAAKLHLADVYEVFPKLRRDEIWGRPKAWLEDRALVERVSLFGSTPARLALLSDVTTSRDESWRPANVNRLMSLLVRTARRLGEESAFEPSGETLWKTLRERMRGLLNELFAIGALRGKSAADAFEVRCDRTTMTQNDIDNGRTICQIAFDPAVPIERINVVLMMNQGGQLSLFAATTAVGQGAG